MLLGIRTAYSYRPALIEHQVDLFAVFGLQFSDRLFELIVAAADRYDRTAYLRRDKDLMFNSFAFLNKADGVAADHFVTGFFLRFEFPDCITGERRNLDTA